MSKSDSLNQVELLPTNIEGVMLFPPLPVGYDPLTAPHESLRAHGIFFPRPDGKRSPHALAKWMRMVHRVPRSDEEAARQRAHLLEKAGKLEPQIGVTHHWRGKRGTPESGSNAIGSWNGAFAPPPGQVGSEWIQATGNFQVPAVSIPFDYAPNPSSRGYDASMWVGIDGAPNTDTTDVLQGGVTAHVDADTGAASYVAWFEWFVDKANRYGAEPGYINQTNITPFYPVVAGDVIGVAVGYLPGGGFVSIFNFLAAWIPYATPNVSYFLPTPNGATVNGSSAEWIVEAPTFGNNSQAVLPAFIDVDFFGCYGLTEPNTPSISVGSAPYSTCAMSTAGATLLGDLLPNQTSTAVDGSLVEVVWLPPIPGSGF